MSFRVAMTFGGNVCVVVEGGLRFDLTACMAEQTARDIRNQIKGRDTDVFATVQALQGRGFRFVGSKANAEQLAGDLESAAAICRKPEDDRLKAFAEWQGLTE